MDIISTNGISLWQRVLTAWSIHVIKAVAASAHWPLDIMSPEADQHASNWERGFVHGLIGVTSEGVRMEGFYSATHVGHSPCRGLTLTFSIYITTSHQATWNPTCSERKPPVG